MADVINTLFVLIKKDAIESSSTSISIDQIFDKSYSRRCIDKKFYWQLDAAYAV